MVGRVLGMGRSGLEARLWGDLWLKWVLLRWLEGL